MHNRTIGPPVGSPSTRRSRPSPAAKKSPASSDLEPLYRLQAEICRAMGHSRRIQILDLLAGGERSGSDLRHSLGIGKVNLSQHLSVMKHAGLIRSRQRGREVLYSLAVPEIRNACQLIRAVLAERLRQEFQLAESLRETEHFPGGGHP